MSSAGSSQWDIVVVGASAGGVEALRSLVRALPADLAAAVFVVVHTAPGGVAFLAEILDRAGPLAAAFAEDGEAIHPGRIYVAPPDRHLLVRNGHVHLTRGPKENRTRPAVNPLFRTAASAYGERVIGVVLTGMLDNGTAGLLAVERAGGTTVVQDPDDAAFPGMPASALEYVDVEHVVPADALPELLARLTAPAVAAGSGNPTPSTLPPEIEEDGMPPAEDRLAAGPPGTASGLTCPECSGALWEVTDAGHDEYVCRIGHLFSPETLLEEQAERRDDLLESALRSLREEAEITERLLERGRERGRERGSEGPGMRRWTRRAAELERASVELERLIRDRDRLPAGSSA